MLAVVALLSSACTGGDGPRSRHLFTEDWTFALTDTLAAKEIDFDDSSWRVLDLPHDWAIEGDFAEDNPSGCGGGALPGGIGWYRKSFNVTADDLQQRIFIDFDGVYMNSTVYINGVEIGHRPYGYISFRYELTQHLHEGKNVVAVRVDNAEQPNSRWYSGCGIYRNVYMVKTSNVYVDNWGTYVTTPLVNDAKADVVIKTTVRNRNKYDITATVVQVMKDHQGKEVATASDDVVVAYDSVAVTTQQMRVAFPRLWSVEDPYRYTIETQIFSGGELTDTYETVCGIRSFYFDAEQGFILNDKNVKINGVCQHHDLGCLGSAVNKRALERQLQMLKDMGCNGIRCSHNPPAPELLQLCDSMGFIVMDETFDMWRRKKTEHDYSRYFDKWHVQDMTDLIVRDRNHPCIFMWSIGNEVLEQWTDDNASELDIQQANLILNAKRDESLLAHGEEMSINSLLCKHLCDIVHELDPTRPVTSGNNEPSPDNHLFKAGTIDIIGYNYHNDDFASVPTNFPGKPFIVTESVSALMTRGYYRMPSDTEIICPERWDKPYYDPSFACSSYDNCRAPWGNNHEGTWRKVKTNDFISGQYIWTGWDYIGEPTPYWWPARSSYFGIIDLAGFKKDIYYMYQSEWTDKTVLHLFPHWNWKEGEVVDMWCFYNNADEVELFVNDESQGCQTRDSVTFHVSWRVQYSPGEVKAVSRKNGKVVAEKTIKTAGHATQLRLTPDRSRILADGLDLSFITVEVLDSEGNLCPFAENEVHFEVEGRATIVGVDNGSPISLERFKDNKRKAFYGKCLVVVKSDKAAGNARVIATSEGLSGDEVTINCVDKKIY